MRNWWRVFFLFFVLGLLVYSNSLNNKFLMDDSVFLSNPVLSQAKYISSQWDPYREQALGVLDSQANLWYYRPLTHILYDLCYPAFKKALWKYHLFNIFIFAFASSLIFLLIARLTGNGPLAFLTGLFYLIHPINGVVVDYISANVFPSEVICILATILFLWESLERNNDRMFYALSLFFSVLSMFWHESGLMTPFYISAVVLLFRKGPFKEKAFYLFPYFLMVMAFMAFRFFFSVHAAIFIRHTHHHMTIWEYPANLFQVFRWYIVQLFWPQGVVLEWAAPISHQNILLNNLGLVSLSVLLILLFLKGTGEKACRLAAVWVLIGFAPVCLAAFRLPNAGVVIEPHWLIFSSIGFFVLAAYFCLSLINRMRMAGALLVFLLVFEWAGISYANNKLWADQITYNRFWSQEVPGLYTPYIYLGQSYMDQGDLKDSRKYFLMALERCPSNIFIYASLATIDDIEGNLKEAELNYKKVLGAAPYSSSVYHDLGIIYVERRQWDKAIGSFNQALAYNPMMLESRSALATVFFIQGDYKKAIGLCLINLNIVNDDPATLDLLVHIYLHKKDFINARQYALRLMHSETDPGMLTDLGSLMAQANVFDLALDCFTKAIQIDPDYKNAYSAAGTFLANEGKFDQAVDIWKIGLTIDPSDRRFKDDIARAEALKLKVK